MYTSKERSVYSVHSVLVYSVHSVLVYSVNSMLVYTRAVYKHLITLYIIENIYEILD